MATSGASKSNRQLALQANVPRILAELHRLAANARVESVKQSNGDNAPVLVIRGK